MDCFFCLFVEMFFYLVNVRDNIIDKIGKTVFRQVYGDAVQVESLDVTIFFMMERTSIMY